MFRYLLILFFLLLATIVVAQDTEQEEETTVLTGQLAYTASGAIYIYDFETGERRLIAHIPQIDSLQFSPDGRLIAYGVHRMDNPQSDTDIFIRDVETGDIITRIDVERDGDLSFSPDGTQVVFAAIDDSGRGNLYISDVDGENIRTLTNRPGVDRMPVWSPNGDVIAFISNSASESNVFEVYTVRPDSNGRRRLTDFNDEQASVIISIVGLNWSPDGESIVFAPRLWFNAVGARPEIFILDVQSRELTQLTDDGLGNAFPTWSPNGEWIAYASSYSTQGPICIITVDGTLIDCLNENSYMAAWRPELSEEDETDD